MESQSPVEERPAGPEVVPDESADQVESSGVGLNDEAFLAEKLGVELESLKSIDEMVLNKMKVQLDQMENLRSEKMVLEMNIEQLNHLSGKKLESLKIKVNKLTIENSSLKESLESSRNSEASQDGKISELEMEKNSILKRLVESQEKISSIEKEKIHSFEIIKRREDELKISKDEVDQLSKNNRELRSELLALETSSQKNSSELLKLKFDKNNLSQELEILKKNSSWYETELNKKMDELKTFKVDKYREFSEVQLELDSTKSELQSLTLKYDNLKNNFDSTTKKLDDSLISVKQLNDKIAYNQEEFLKEMSSKDKLIEILRKSNDEMKQRVTSLQSSLDTIKTENVKDSSDLQIKLEQSTKKIQKLELKIKELESVIDELSSSPSGNVETSMLSQTVGSIPSTPKPLRNFNQQVPLSPSAQQTLAKIGGGVSLTQLYSDFQLMRKQLIKERRLKENLERQVNQFVEELNKQVPAITATKEKCNILELELTDISILLEKTSKEKDHLLKENKNWSKKLNEYELELKTLSKSRLDLSRQVSHLIIQLSLKLDGDSPLTAQEKQFVDKLVGEYANGYNDESDTDRLITERLVKFNSVVDLTSKNQELLKITRQLGNQLENQEIANQQKMDNLESIAIDEAREAIIVLQEQISSLESKLSSITRERDMFRSIAGGHKQQQNNVFNSTPNTTALDIRESSGREESLELQLSQTQDELKTYRKETDSTMKILNKQINDLTNAKSELAVQLARATSSAQLFEERYKSIQQTLQYSKSENDEIRKRSNILQDNLSKHDVTSQQLTEELIQTKSLAESMSLEISNLKLEKQLWKSIEKRLNDENSSLMDERLRLNSLTSELRRLENERDQGFKESTTRLNATIASLEDELSLLKTKLDSNTEELRSALLRKDTDAKAYQERIDSLRNEAESAREDLLKRRTLTNQLEKTVEDLKRNLSDAEKQLKSYESIDELDSQGNVETKLRQEFQKSKLELQNSVHDLAAANESVEQFRLVAEAAEARLEDITTSYDSYKASIEQKLKESGETNENLTKQIEDLNTKVSQLQKKLETAGSEQENFINSLKQEIESLKLKASSSDEIKEEYEQRMELIKHDLEQQAKIAADAQQSYEQELQKHAEVSSVNSKLREEESLLKIKIQELTIEARDSKTALTTAQESWGAQKLTLEEELRVAESRVGDLNLQNRMLLNQLEQLTKDQRESYAKVSGNSEVPTTTNGSSEELLQVISFLRHEKEISDAQLEVSQQEQRRLQQNLELTKLELEDVKTEMVKLQTRENHSKQLEENYKALTLKIDQLDVMRESNATLMQENQNYAAQITSLEEKLSANADKLEPMELQIVNLRLELETRTKELQSEKTIVEFWKNKNQEILQNYNRIDPSEHESLKAQVTDLQQKLTDLEAGYQAERKKSIREANDRLTKFKGIIDTTKKELTEEKLRTAELQKEIESLQTKLSEGGVSVTADDKESQQALTSLKEELEKSKELLVKANEQNEKSLKELTESRDSFKKQVDDLNLKVSSTELPNDGDFNVEAFKESLEKEKQEFIKQKNSELEQLKFKLKIEIKRELEARNAAKPAASVDVEALKKQLEEEHAKDVEVKIKEACDALKAKIREPHEAKIKSIANKRFEKYKQEADVEIKKKEEELVKQYEAKMKGGSNKELEDEIKRLKESIEAECKKAKEEGRASALKEGEMRYKMTKRQLDKAKAELATLKGGSAPSSASSQTQPSSIPSKPAINVPSVNNSNSNSNSKIPTHNFRENLKKPQVLNPQLLEESKKRAADTELANGEGEKKTKTESDTQQQ